MTATFLYLFLCLMDVAESYEVVSHLTDFCRDLGVPDQWMILRYLIDLDDVYHDLGVPDQWMILRYLIDLDDVIPSVSCYR